MRDGECPECRGRSIIETVPRERNFADTTSDLPAALVYDSGPTGVWSFLGPLQLYICTGCELTHWYVGSPELPDETDRRVRALSDRSCELCSRSGGVVQVRAPEVINNSATFFKAVTYEPNVAGHGRNVARPYGILRVNACRYCGFIRWWAENSQEIPVDIRLRTRAVPCRANVGDPRHPFRSAPVSTNIRDGTCPRCQQGHVLAARATDFAGGEDTYVGVTYAQKSKSPTPLGVLVRYVCRHCGFCEHFSLEAATIPIGEDWGTRVVL